jgi:twitching motility protein PilT
MLERLAKYARNHKLSDLHIHPERPVAIRVHGEIEKFPDDVVSKDEIEKFFDESLDADQKEFFKKNKQIDFAVKCFEFRFRVNGYLSSIGPSLVLRKIETKIPAIEDLGLPQAMLDVVNQENGLVLVTGPTGSGKSTSLAALINAINMERSGNIITAEDPIEYVHESKKCIVSQREIGRDAVSFAHALKAMLREDPDVILVGELRDYETVSLALTAAETGHLVFGTLHTNGAPSTINRIIDVFPSEQQNQARSQLSQSLRLVVTQKLLKKADGTGRVAAFEVMVNNSAIGNLIRENKIFQIAQAMQTGKQQGMITMEDSMRDLFELGYINEEAMNENSH